MRGGDRFRTCDLDVYEPSRATGLLHPASFCIVDAWKAVMSLPNYTPRWAVVQCQPETTDLMPPN